ncbi:hypothetical protein [Spirillospora albida]|uniref:hypothetical protein n=1 Tax=Spirillospora albida TaxID=58123 RepID=UPI0004C18EB1|nr:hypothetical protein [Spirillospora albida]
MPNVNAAGRPRADACPGTLQTHTAADGALARVRTPGGALTAARLRVLGAAARELGTDVIELTSRANVQLRGVRDPAGLARRAAAAGLLPSPAHERVRNIAASPLGGRGEHGVLATDGLVTALDEALCADPALAALPGRFLFAFDDGTGDITPVEADVTATPSGLRLAGRDLDLPVPDPVAAMLAAAGAFLGVRGTEWRLAEVPDGPGRVARHLGGTLLETPPAAPRPPRAGVIEQRDGRVALEAVPPLGRMSGAQLEALADVADEVRFTPWRSVVLRDLARDEAGGVAARLAAAGFATEASSPWVGVSACTGSPGCARSRADVQAEARAWVAGLDGPPDVPVHWAGCERRCGTPRGPVVLRTAGTATEERQ